MMKGMGGLLKQAQKFQEDLARVREELAGKTVEGTAGGGMVTATVNGRMDLVALRIDKEVVDPDDIDMLQDLAVAAVNEAVRKSREMAAGELKKLTGGLPVPGMENLFG